MNDKEKDQVFEKLNKTIEYVTTEYDIQYDELIGMLEQIKHRILMDYYNDNIEDGLCEDCRRELGDEFEDVDLPPNEFDENDEDKKDE
jgi:hypothetical protein